MKVDFHTHTYHSFDSLMKPILILETARKRGLNCIVICDHNTIKGGVEAKSINPYKDFTVIVGAEMATDAGDVTGIFLNKEIKTRKFRDVALEIKSQGGKVILNHPFKGHDLSKVDFALVDYIEGYNSRLNAELNAKAQELARQHNIPIVAGSDSHVYGEIGRCYSVIDSLESMITKEHRYIPSKQIYITTSQYIKAWKRKSISLFISASVMFIKRMIS